MQDEVGYTPRPANLGGVRAAYAIYMVGDSMQPRYEQGWLLHVNPFKPPTRGRDVVVYKQGQIVLIKQFVGWEGDALVLRQFNPPDTLQDPPRRGARMPPRRRRRSGRVSCRARSGLHLRGSAPDRRQPDQAASARAASSITRPLSLALTRTVEPSGICPLRISSASGFCNSRWITRFNGRAP